MTNTFKDKELIHAFNHYCEIQDKIVTFGSPEYFQKTDELAELVNREKSFVLLGGGLKRAAVVALISASALIFSVKAVRDKVTGFFVTTFERFSLIVRIDDDDESAPSEIEEFYEPAFIPDGYHRESEEKIATKYEVNYSNGVEPIVFKQRERSDALMNTENVENEEIQVNGCKGVYYENNGVRNIVWEDAGYQFKISGILDKELLNKMAISVKKVEIQ